jgi:hypothetical protein
MTYVKGIRVVLKIADKLIHESMSLKLAFSVFVFSLKRNMYIFHNLFHQVVGLERGPLSLVSTSEELLDRKVAAPV